ncbi:leucine-rich_repeat domain-containing protein [Hexamita inflata]|uniref:Leucine-rich repeat domain-containing protein n=1 Tax=Hexamita inflata TaxID=28002 RepID=A0AA86QVV1_9EUKA|nr:leucine-rich repeat domain-containing protein [Hexamita inflata]
MDPNQNIETIDSIDKLRKLDYNNEYRLMIENVALFNFNFLPFNISHLTVRSCNILNIFGVQNIKNLVYIDISNNPIYSIQDLQSHHQLEVLNISNTFVVNVAVLNHLRSLKEFKSENCYIIDQQPLIRHENYNIHWICHQQSPTLNILQILNPTLSETQHIGFPGNN